MVIIVGNSTDPDKEINNTFSNFPKVDFSIVQNTSSLPTSTFTPTQPSTLAIIPKNPENIINNGNTNYSYKNNIETWKIIVITIFCIIFLLISFFCIWIYRKKKFLKSTKEYKESKNIEIIYEKPNFKVEKNIIYQKPNQIV